MLLNGISLALRRLATGRKVHEHEFQRPHTFSDHIARMVLKTRYLLGNEENEAADDQYLWQTVTGRYPMLYSEVTASQQIFSRGVHSCNSRSETKGRRRNPFHHTIPIKHTLNSELLSGQSHSHKQTKSKHVNRASSVEEEPRRKTNRSCTNKTTGSINYIVEHNSPNSGQVAPIPLYHQPLLIYSHFYLAGTEINPNTSSIQKVIEYLREYLQSKDHICLNAISSVPILSVYPASSSSNSGGVIPPIDFYLLHDMN